MPLRFPKKVDKSGIVLIFVLIVIMVMAIFSATIFSQSISQSKTSRAQADQIVAEELAKGHFWSSYNQSFPSFAFPLSCPNCTTYSLNGRTYQASVVNPGSGSAVTVSISY